MHACMHVCTYIHIYKTYGPQERKRDKYAGGAGIPHSPAFRSPCRFTLSLSLSRSFFLHHHCHCLWAAWSISHIYMYIVGSMRFFGCLYICACAKFSRARAELHSIYIVYIYYIVMYSLPKSAFSSIHMIHFWAYCIAYTWGIFFSWTSLDVVGDTVDCADHCFVIII